MCGIAGIIKWTHQPPPWQPRGAAPASHPALDAMQNAIAHRGPDGLGRWLDPRPDKTAALLHARLAILDLPGGTQPMPNETGRVLVTFNGEIYNHAALRRELQAAGHRFTTDHSDTEVLVHGWEQWGENLPAKLLGMFAFAIWDMDRDTLFLARDRMGQKPLFYAQLDDGVVFASTIPAVLAWPEVPRRIPREHIAMVLRLSFMPPPWTIYQDIAQLRPGHWLRVRGDVVTGEPYWKLPSAPAAAPQSPPPTPVEIRESIERAVASHLISDVPVACFLSGGLDSSIVASVMQRAVSLAGGNAIHTVSVGFAEDAFDETNFAALVAQRIGSQHTRLQVDAGKDVMATLEHLMRHQLGQPFGDSSILPTYHLSRAVRDLAPVALAGDGADELFAGYDRYRALPMLRKWAGVLQFLPEGLASRGAKGERLRRLIHAARGGHYAVGCYPRLLEIFRTAEIEELLGSAFAAETEVNDWEGIRFAMAQDQREYLPGDILYKVDSASMAHALEVRAPFLDHLVVEASWRLTPHQLIHNKQGKAVLRQAFADALPREILHRSKKGFAVPIGEWFRGPLRQTLHDTLSASNSFARQHLRLPPIERLLAQHQSGARDHTHRLFTLLMLELWWKAFGGTMNG